MRKAIAIDFDGCLCTEAYPEIGEPNWPVIQRAKQEQQAGAGLILWTVREGQLLQDALDACKRWGLTFDAVNESLPDWIEAYGNRPRKVGASEYWDDRAVRMPAKERLICRSKRLTKAELKIWIDPVWCSCRTMDGADGFWCLCDKGIITAPSGQSFSVDEIPDWKLYPNRTEVTP